MSWAIFGRYCHPQPIEESDWGEGYLAPADVVQVADHLVDLEEEVVAARYESMVPGGPRQKYPLAYYLSGLDGLRAFYARLADGNMGADLGFA